MNRTLIRFAFVLPLLGHLPEAAFANDRQEDRQEMVESMPNASTAPENLADPASSTESSVQDQSKSFDSKFFSLGFTRPTFHNDSNSYLLEYSDINSLLSAGNVRGIGFAQSYSLFGFSGRSQKTLIELYSSEIGEKGFRYDKNWGLQGDWGLAITIAKRKSMGVIGLASAGIRVFDAYDFIEDSHWWLGQAYTRLALRVYFSEAFVMTFGQVYNTGLSEYHSGIGATEFSLGFGMIQ